MQVTGSMGSSAASLLQALMKKDETQATSARQEMQGARQAMPGGRPPPPMAEGSGAAQMSGGTMSGMVSLQMEQPAAEDAASAFIDSLDADGDGEISLDEMNAALEAAGLETDDGAGFASLDADGGGGISADELASAIEADMQARGPHGPPPGPPPSGEDMADDLLSAFDSDEDDGLSLGEVTSALGLAEDDTEAAGAFASLDEDGDGRLSGAEIAAAFNARMREGLKAYAQTATLA